MKRFVFATAIFLSVSITGSADLFHPLNLVKTEGSTPVERIETPYEFKRIKQEKGSFAEYLRNYPLKPAGSPVLLYNRLEKQNQDAHAAIFNLPLEENDLQDASGSIIRLYAEYMYKSGLKQEINFHFMNGSECKWTEWEKKFLQKRETRTNFAADLKKWTKYEKSPKESEIFNEYLNKILQNTSILTIQTYESVPTTFEALQIGDILWDLGRPEHICLVVDLCINPKTGERAVLLAQGNTPAQEFHILVNPKRVNDPWYYEQDFYMPANTPEHIFPKNSWRHVTYLK